MYNNELKKYSYVCPRCFNLLNKCECDQYPEMLIQIDKHMVPIIKKLNDIHYKTEGCCEGHIGKFDKIYIFFVVSLYYCLGFRGGSVVKNPPAKQETWVGSLG